MSRKRQKPLSDLVTDALNPLHHLRIMGRLVRRSAKPPGLPPGTLVHTGLRKVEATRVTAIQYGPDGFEESEWDAIPERFSAPGDGRGVLWVNVEGLHDVEILRSVGDTAGVHPLAMEDVASVGQRPKVEDYGDHLFLVVHMLQVQDEPFAIVDEQVSMVIGPNYLVSFQEAAGDVFDPVRERLRSGTGRIRSLGPDYLAYALVDALVDSYFRILEQIGERIEQLEVEVADDPTEESMHHLHHLKRELIVLRRSVWPLREMMAAFLRVEGPLLSESTKLYLRDIHDHSYQLIDTVEVLRDITAGVRDLYLTSVSNRTNDVMKVLTVMASIFIPLTFIAGVYGMNFEYMPELGFTWAYPAVLATMVVVGLGLLGIFRWRGWI